MRLVREPFLHFLALGLLLFIAHAAFGTGEENATLPTAVRVAAADGEWLREMWTRQWRRRPTNEEFARLVTDHIKEEVLAREAKALGMDVGDTVVQRRLAQKMAFLLDDVIRTAEPPEAELRALYETRPDLVRRPRRVSFEHIFFRREDGDGRARASLAILSDATAAPKDLGDRLLLGDRFSEQDEQALTSLFGTAFARTILELPVGQWSGPVESGFGLHLVRVVAVSPPQPRPFTEIRERLAEEWRRAQQEAAQAQVLRGLVQKYRVTVDPSVGPFLGPLADQVEVQP
jgi:hypothetical protein